MHPAILCPVHPSFSRPARFTFRLPACTSLPLSAPLPRARSSASPTPSHLHSSDCTYPPSIYLSSSFHRPISLGPSPLLSATTSENGFSTCSKWFSESFAHMRPSSSSYSPSRFPPPPTRRAPLVQTRAARLCAWMHAHRSPPDRYYDDGYARTTFFPAPSLTPPPLLRHAVVLDLFRSFCN